MTIALITFVATFVAMVVMIYLQIHRTTTGKSFVFFRHGHKTDKLIGEKVQRIKHFFNSITLAKIGFIFHRVLDSIESGFIRGKDVVVARSTYFLKKLRAVEGKIKPGKKNVSSFIKDIQDEIK